MVLLSMVVYICLLAVLDNAFHIEECYRSYVDCQLLID